MTDTIVRELQMRKSKRGGIAQIRKLDHVLGKLKKIGIQVPALLDSMGISFEKKPEPAVERRPLATKTIDVSNYIEMVLGCTTKTLTLDAEEAKLTRNGLCAEP